MWGCVVSSTIFATLKKLGLTSESTRFLYNERTRDIENLKVWKDKASGVIFIDNYFTGDDTYISGLYRDDKNLYSKIGNDLFENEMDLSRRVEFCLKFVSGKKIADFGCGNGNFLKAVKPFCADAIGIELQEDYVKQLNDVGIRCERSLSIVEDNSLDVVVSFHVIEHLQDPIEKLKEIVRKLKSGGKVLIEVPHANDFLLSTMENDEFKQFTLWSQHLILHTRNSLLRLMDFVGLEDVQIKGVQRYPLSNHLNWLANRKPGGHKSKLAVLDTLSLFSAYESALASIDATDTLFVTASKQ